MNSKGVTYNEENSQPLWVKRVLKWMLEQSTLVVFVVMLIVAHFMSDRFYTGDNITNVLRQSVPLGIVAIGLLFVILTGGIDLSVGSVMALCAVATAITLPSYGLFAGLLVGIGTGLICGAVSGFFVAFGRMAPFVATLVTMTVCRGLALIWSKGQPIFVDNESFVDFGVGYLWGLPMPVYVLIAAFLLAAFVLHKMMFGRMAIAIGSNETATRFSGIKVPYYKFSMYALSGLACGVAGIISATRTGVGSPILGIAFELDAIAACVIGGASLSGGRGTAFNTVLGVLILSMISNLMNLMNIPGYNQQVVKGVIIALAVLIEGFKNKRA
ncbi:MAG: ABC transporter permease [Spartobacteria bacterium]|nr:ABC transporter permease [Spartobacteria bacterium]